MEKMSMCSCMACEVWELSQEPKSCSDRSIIPLLPISSRYPYGVGVTAGLCCSSQACVVTWLTCREACALEHCPDAEVRDSGAKSGDALQGKGQRGHKFIPVRFTQATS